jgi:hypothetical protein
MWSLILSHSEWIRWIRLSDFLLANKCDTVRLLRLVMKRPASSRPFLLSLELRFLCKPAPCHKDMEPGQRGSCEEELRPPSHPQTAATHSQQPLTAKWVSTFQAALQPQLSLQVTVAWGEIWTSTLRGIPNQNCETELLLTFWPWKLWELIKALSQ